MSSEQASAAAAWYAEQYTAAETALAEQHKTELERLGKEWDQQVRDHSELGGAQYDATVQRAKEAVVRFGGETLSAGLEELGISNYPPLVEAFAKVGAALAEHTATGPGSGSPPSGEGKPEYSEMYPSMAQ